MKWVPSNFRETLCGETPISPDAARQCRAVHKGTTRFERNAVRGCLHGTTRIGSRMRYFFAAHATGHAATHFHRARAQLMNRVESSALTATKARLPAAGMLPALRTCAAPAHAGRRMQKSRDRLRDTGFSWWCRGHHRNSTNKNWSGREDSNLRLLRPERSTLPG
jgi:hypothetical protein